MRTKIITTLLVTMVLVIAGCALPQDYQFGDISKTMVKQYCESTNPEFREFTKGELKRYGINIGVDYCTTRGLVDAMVTLSTDDSVALPVDYGGHVAFVKPVHEKLYTNARMQNNNFEQRYNL